MVSTSPSRATPTNVADRTWFPDDNRGVLLEAGFPQTVLGLLESYAESVKPAQRTPFPISVADLKIVKTAIGFLLNASVGYGGWRTCSSTFSRHR